MMRKKKSAPRAKYFTARYHYKDRVGFVILALGLACFVSVAALAFLRGGGSREAIPVPAAAKSDKPGGNAEKAFWEEKNAPAPGPQALMGAWQSALGTGRAYFQINQSYFQIIYMDDKKAANRRYSSGTYEYEPREGLITLTPQRSLPPPAQPGISYSILTRRAFSLKIAQERKSGDLYWIPPAPGHRTDKMHPLFFLSGEAGPQKLRWQRLQ